MRDAKREELSGKLWEVVTPAVSDQVCVNELVTPAVSDRVCVFVCVCTCV